MNHDVTFVDAAKTKTAHLFLVLNLFLLADCALARHHPITKLSISQPILHLWVNRLLISLTINQLWLLVLLHWWRHIVVLSVIVCHLLIKHARVLLLLFGH